jgi:hypothetical protein
MGILNSDTTNLPTAANDLLSWTSKAVYQNIKDPLRFAARVISRMSTAIADLLRTETDYVSSITDRMAVINGYMQKLNTAIGTVKAQPDNYNAAIAYGNTHEELKNLGDAIWTASEGAPAFGTKYDVWGNQPHTGSTDVYVAVAPGYSRVLVANKGNLTAATQNLQIKVDSLSSTNQQAQLKLQTLMGRYNSAFELVSNILKKAETQAESATSNFKK